MQKKETPQPKVFTPVTNFSSMPLEQRFDVKLQGGRLFAPYSWGSPSVTLAVHYDTFRKTDEERTELATAKKAHNKKFFSIFGTKRPTAGIVKRHYLNPNL